MNILPILVAVLNSLWQAALVAVLVWAALRFLLRNVNAATRHVIWWATLAVVLILPVAPQAMAVLRAQAKPVPVAIVGPAGLPRLDAPAAETSVIVTLHEERRARWPLWILGLWAALFLYRMLQIVRSYFYLRSLKRSSCVSSQALPPLTRSATLLLSADVASPMAVGFLRPAVILPESLPNELEQVEMEHVLLHEAAHIARYDDWTNLAVRLAGAVLALHPVALWILRQIEREREMACDDWVVARTGSARPYAASLARISEMRWSRKKDFPGLKLASGLLGGGSEVGDRIELLLKRGRDFSARVSRARVGAGAVVLLMFVMAGSFMPRWIAFGQQPSAVAFEVASVKLNVSGSDRQMTIMPPRSSSFTAMNTNLKRLILIAYQVDEPRILGGPEWIKSDGFDIVAKPPQSGADVNQSRLMLQALLADRFKLKIRRETREVPVYALVTSKNGLKLADAKEGSCVVLDPQSAPPKAGGVVPPCGGTLRGPNLLAGGKSSMVEFAFALGNILGRPVIDKTGYTGTFSYRLEFTPEGVAGQPADAGATDSSKPSIFTAVQEQLGLRLESQKGPAEVLVIDHAEKPDAN